MSNFLAIATVTEALHQLLQAEVEDDVNVESYSDDKMHWIRAGLERAELWAAVAGWAP